MSVERSRTPRRRYRALLTPIAIWSAFGVSAAIARDPRAAAKTLRDFVVVRTSSLFVDDWYLEQGPEAGADGIDPAMHYVQVGAEQDLDPGPRFSTKAYRIANPDVTQLDMNPLVHYLRFGHTERRHGTASAAAGFPLVGRPKQPRYVEPTLRTVSVPATGPRLTLLVESVRRDSPVEGVLTATVVSALLAKQLDARLRIVTLREAPERPVAKEFLDSQGVEWNGDIEFEFAHLHDPSARLAVTDDDVFLTTSWWTTAAVRRTRPVERLAYLIGEDERLLYPPGELSLRAQEVMCDPSLRCLVRSRMLFDHLKEAGIATLEDRGSWFEPAFPQDPRPPAVPRAGHRRLALFASPTVPGDLYYRGIDALDMALRTGVLDPDEWSIELVGRDLEPVTLARDVNPELVEVPGWDGREALIRDVDVGLVLGYAPHPRDWALRLVADGGVAVANQYGSDDGLAQYSERLVSVTPDLDAIVEGLGRAELMPAGPDARRAGAAQVTFQRDWSVALARAFSSLVDGWKDV